MKKVHVLDLKCGQMALGMLEVRKKAEGYRKMSKKEFHKENKKNPVSVIIGPDECPYVIDGHHHAVAVWLCGFSKVYVKVLKDFSRQHVSKEDFWRYLKMHRCIHLYDQFGNGPHDIVYLPRDIRGLGDDPYRSLVWSLQKAGLIEKTKVRFAEFQWANFFRKKKLLHGRFERDFEAIQPKAAKLARSQSARGLPGFLKKRKKGQAG